MGYDRRRIPVVTARPRIVVCCSCGDDMLAALAGFALGAMVGLMIGVAVAAVVVAGLR